MTTPIEFFRFWIVDERTGKRRRTTYKMTRADAARTFPGAEPDLSSRDFSAEPTKFSANQPLWLQALKDRPENAVYEPNAIY